VVVHRRPTNSRSGRLPPPLISSVRKAGHKPLARSAVVIGASSGIGAAVAVELARRGYTVGIAARRLEALREVAAQHPGIAATARLDLHDVTHSRAAASDLITALGGADVFIIAAGTGSENPGLKWGPEADTIAVNVTGFAALATLALEHFVQRGRGQLVGISSIAAIRGHGEAPSYGASKAFVSSYLRALRHKCARQGLPVHVTEIQPGFVATAMAKGDGLFWVAPVDVAAHQIVTAIESRKAHAYVTKRWRVIAGVLRILPEWIYNRL
jgi:short-subunit dehydrogenase